MAQEEKNNSRGTILLIIIILFLFITIFVNANYDNNAVTKINATIDIDNGDEKINWNRYHFYDIELKDSLDIAQSGTYHLTGELNNGSINIDVGTEDVVRLVLDNVTINSPAGPAINCVGGNDLVIELVGQNYLSDGETYAADIDEDAKGVLYSRADLTLMGEGSLTISSNYQDGIIGKDDLKIKSGTYYIKAKDDAIRGKDSVYIINGDFTIESTADAIKSTNEVIPNKGFVVVENGNFNIQSGAKGVKAINSILIYNGNFNINTHDDAIHSNSYVGILGGNYDIISGDDGIHADRELIFDNGSVNILKSYEGLEAQAITINNGKISIISADDGVNAGGGADASAVNRLGANNFKTDETCAIIFNGGDLYINATGDGIDSNGSIYFNGGRIVVDGPTNNGNGALDSEFGITMNGGEVIAVGASGMATDLGEKSTVYNISVYFASNQPINTKIEIRDSFNNTILEHTSAKTFNHLSAGSQKIIPGATYAIYLNDEKYQDFTASNVVTVIGNPRTNQNNIPHR